MKVFIAALDEGGLRKAGRKLGRSPATISRALAFLETHVGVTRLHRTTRSFKLSEAGERYAVVCPRVISDLEEADLVAAGPLSPPRGALPITAPASAGGAARAVPFRALLDTPTPRSVIVRFPGCGAAA